MKRSSAIALTVLFVAMSVAAYALFRSWANWKGDPVSVPYAFLLMNSPLVVYMVLLPFVLMSRWEPGRGRSETGGIDRLVEWKKELRETPAPRSRREPKRYPLRPREINGTKGDLERLTKAKPRLEARDVER